jgi:hypothetical protein
MGAEEVREGFPIRKREKHAESRDASLKKDTESFFREWLDASQRRTP